MGTAGEGLMKRQSDPQKGKKLNYGEPYLPSPSLCRCIALKSMRGKVIRHDANKWKNGKKHYSEHTAQAEQTIHRTQSHGYQKHFPETGQTNY